MHLKFLFFVLAVAYNFNVSHGKVVKYFFEVDYYSGAPDGVFTDHILSVNGQFPGPTIEAYQGDTLEVTVLNKIQDHQNVSIHWHGIHHRTSIFEDGVNMVTQCPIRYGAYEIYRFDLPLAGTYWYHSHVNSQYTEGLVGALIIHPATYHEPYRTDGEITILLSDWYHHTAHENEAWFLSPASLGVPPYPDSSLINGLGRYPCTFAVQDNRNCSEAEQFRPVFTIAEYATYRLRVINAAGYASFNFSIDGHILETIEVDGVEVFKPVFANVALISPGQRYSFILRPSREEYRADRFLIRSQIRLDFLRAGANNINQFRQALLPETTAVIHRTFKDLSYYPHLVVESKEHFPYEKIIPPPIYQKIYGSNGTIVLLDEMELTPMDGIAPGHFDEEHFIITDQVIVDGVVHLAFNNTPFVLPDQEPLLFTALDPSTDGTLPPGANAIQLQGGNVIQLVIQHPNPGSHPFHLHGHHFYVVRRGLPNEGIYDPSIHKLNLAGPKRDVIFANSFSHVVIRFLADNPGVWTFHCHIDWHLISGMGFVFVEDLPTLRQRYNVTDEQRRLCQCDLFNSNNL